MAASNSIFKSVLEDALDHIALSVMDIERSFPSEWFKSHPNCKPKILHPKTKLSDIELYNYLYEHWGKDSLSVDIACDFAIRTLKEIKETTDDTWHSFGVTIATPGSNISPMDLLDIEETEVDSASLPSSLQSAPLEETLSMLGLVMSVYGIDQRNTKNNLQYCSEIQSGVTWRDRLSSILKNFRQFTTNKFVHSPILYRDWNRNWVYQAIIAATDMFFSKFKESKFSKLRSATQASRWKGCSALVYIELLSDTLSLPKSDCYRLIFSPQVVYEIRKMQTEGQELHKEDSYSPYLLDLGLCDKSPYSGCTNYFFYHFVNFIGSIYGVRRCQDSLMLGKYICYTTDRLLKAAVSVSYYLQMYDNFTSSDKCAIAITMINNDYRQYNSDYNWQIKSQWLLGIIFNWTCIKPRSCAKYIMDYIFKEQGIQYLYEQ